MSDYSNRISRKRKLKRALLSMSPIYPPDYLIQDYKDFLKEKEWLDCYVFNEKVFNALVYIAFEHYMNNKRYDRKRLFYSIKRYALKKPKSEKFQVEIIERIFEIFRLSYNDQKEIEFYACNILLKNQQLSNVQIKWMIMNAFESEQILNRILRYPNKNILITDWANYYFEDDRLRDRRVELIGKVLDFNQDFKLNKETLIEDFNFFLKEDERSFEQFETPYFVEKDGDIRIDNTYAFSFTKQRPFDYYMSDGPNFIMTREMIFKKIDWYYNRTMLWGIYYSNIEKQLKESLLRNYFYEELYQVLFYIAEKMNSIRLLKWLLNKI